MNRIGFIQMKKSCDFRIFVPGENKKVWTKTTNVCIWSPPGVDINGQSPSRHIEKHVHGEGKIYKKDPKIKPYRFVCVWVDDS